MQMHFNLAEKAQASLILTWLAQPHIQQWLHGQGLQNTIEDLEKFFQNQSLFQHWIAYDADIPFAYLLTSHIQKNEESEYSHHCNKNGEAISLDVFIGNEQYLGKGIAHHMIQTFLLSQFREVDEILIDPELTNTRAIHVYEKAGFQKVGRFIPSWHPVPHLIMRLRLQDLILENVNR